MQNLLKKYNIKAKKSLGQNFLVSEKILTDISEIIEIKNKNIIEVWPWFWALTEKILEKNPFSLTLVELDSDMIKILEDRIKNNDLDISKTKNFKIKNIDVLKFEVKENNPSPTLPSNQGREQAYSVIANIPYYITSPILRHFLYDIKNIPEKMVILMQKDVWDKILQTSPQNSPTKEGVTTKNKIKSSVLGLFIAKKCNVSEKLFVWKNNFIPAPKVESSVLLFETHKKFEKIPDEKFLKIIKIWFSANRKKLIKNLEKWWYKKENLEKIFEKLNIDKNARAENLTIEKWCELVENL